MAPTYSKPCRKSSVPINKATELDLLLIATQKVRPALDALLSALEQSVSGCHVAVKEVGLLVESLLTVSTEALSCCSCSCRDALCRWFSCAFTRADGPPLVGNLPIIFVLYILVLLYNAFVFAYLPAAGLAINSPTSLVFHALVFMVLSSFIQAVRTDPGSVPEDATWKCRGTPPPEVSEFKRSSGEPRWCRNTSSYKPDRAHYCQASGRVVLRMDHFCPWIGNTVGFANHKFFYLLIFYTNAACAMLNISVLELLTHVTLPALTKFLLIGSAGVSTLLLTLLGPFFLFHCWLLGSNMTSVELSQHRRHQEEAGGQSSVMTATSPYDVGLYANICAVLGKNPLLWFLPAGRPSGNGLCFPRASEHALGMTDSTSSEEDDREEEDQKGEEEREELVDEKRDVQVLDAVQQGEAGKEETSVEEKEEARRGSSLAVLGAALLEETSLPASSLGRAIEMQGVRREGDLEEGRDASSSSDSSWKTPDTLVVAAGVAWKAASELTDDFRVGFECVGEGCENVKEAAVHSIAEAVVGLGDAVCRFRSICSSSSSSGERTKKKRTSEKRSSKASSAGQRSSTSTQAPESSSRHSSQRSSKDSVTSSAVTIAVQIPAAPVDAHRKPLLGGAW